MLYLCKLRPVQAVLRWTDACFVTVTCSFLCRFSTIERENAVQMIKKSTVYVNIKLYYVGFSRPCTIMVPAYAKSCILLFKRLGIVILNSLDGRGSHL